MSQPQTVPRDWSLGLFLMALVMAVLAFIPVGFEPWSHLAMGRVADTFGTIPDRNLYVFILDPSVEVGTLEWLGQWWMYKVFGEFGLYGLMALRATLAGLSIALAVIIGRVPRVLAILAAVGFVVGGAAMTPAMFGGAVLVLASLVIMAVADKRIRSGWLITLILPVAVLVHVDGVFALIALLALWAAKTPNTKWAWISATLVMLATLVNPRDFEVWWLAFRQLHLIGLADIASVLVLALAGVFAFRRSKSSEYRALVIAVGIFALLRIELAAFAVLVLGLMPGDEQEKTKIPLWGACLALVVAIVLQPLWAWWPPLAGALNIGRASGPYAHVLAKNVPHDAVQIVKAWGGRAMILNTPETAGLWMWELGEKPYPVVFTGPEHLRELRNQKMVDLTFTDVQVLRGILHQYDVRAALLPKTGFEVTMALLQEEPRWQLTWEDSRWVLLTR